VPRHDPDAAVAEGPRAGPIVELARVNTEDIDIVQGHALMAVS
jgi:hypothetical protein